MIKISEDYYLHEMAGYSKQWLGLYHKPCATFVRYDRTCNMCHKQTDPVIEKRAKFIRQTLKD